MQDPLYLRAGDVGLHERKIVSLLHRTVQDRLQPVWMSPNLFLALLVETLHVGANIDIIRLPVVEMAQKQVMFPALDFAQRDQVVRVKLQVGMQMKWLDVMDLDSQTCMAAGRTGRLAQEVLLFNPVPFRTPLTPMSPSHLRSMIAPAHSAGSYWAQTSYGNSRNVFWSMRTLSEEKRKTQKQSNNDNTRQDFQ